MGPRVRAPWRFCWPLVALVAATACKSARAERESETSANSAAPMVSAAPAATAPVASSSSPSPSPSTSTSTSGCPEEMALVGKTCVDRWEAHLVVRGDNGVETAHPHSDRPADGVRYIARSSSGVYPQAYISRLEARAACEAAGKRLCTLGEWYRACRGPKGLTYPYGQTESRTKCNVAKPHLLAKLFGNVPGNWSYAAFNDRRLNLEPGFLAKAGEYEECVGEHEIHDMLGNLHEWVSDVVGKSLEAKIPLRDDIKRKIPVNTGHGIFMGGFYSTLAEHGRGCGFITIGHEFKYHDYSTGFRCCKSVEGEPAK